MRQLGKKLTTIAVIAGISLSSGGLRLLAVEQPALAPVVALSPTPTASPTSTPTPLPTLSKKPAPKPKAKPKPKPSPSSSTRAAAVVRVALAQRGKPYVWAAEGPSSFDCSGLVVYAYRHGAGVTLPHFTGALWTRGRVVGRAQLRPGDLIFPSTHHVQLYIGNGKIVDASRPGEPVKVRPLGTFVRAVRIL